MSQRVMFDMPHAWCPIPKVVRDVGLSDRTEKADDPQGGQTPKAGRKKDVTLDKDFMRDEWMKQSTAKDQSLGFLLS